MEVLRRTSMPTIWAQFVGIFVNHYSVKSAVVNSLWYCIIVARKPDLDNSWGLARVVNSAGPLAHVDLLIVGQFY